MNPYQFFAERKKEPPCATQIIVGRNAHIIGHNGKNTISGGFVLPEDWWANMCRSKTSVKRSSMLHWC